MNHSISYPRGGGGNSNYQKFTALLEALGYSTGGADVVTDPEGTLAAQNEYTGKIASGVDFNDPTFDARKIDTSMINRVKPASGFSNFLTGGAGSKQAAEANLKNTELLSDLARTKDLGVFANNNALNLKRAEIPIEVDRQNALNPIALDQAKKVQAMTLAGNFEQAQRMQPLARQSVEDNALISKFGAYPSNEVIDTFKNTNIPAQSDTLLTGSQADTAKNLLAKDLATRDIGIASKTGDNVTDAAVADAAAKKILSEGTLAQAPRQVDLNKSNLETGFVKNFNDATLGGYKNIGKDRVMHADYPSGINSLINLPDEKSNRSAEFLEQPLQTVQEQPFGQPTDPLGNPLVTKQNRDIRGVTGGPLSNGVGVRLDKTPLAFGSRGVSGSWDSAPDENTPLSTKTNSAPPPPAENLNPVDSATKKLSEDYGRWMQKSSNKGKSFSEYLAELGAKLFGPAKEKTSFEKDYGSWMK